MDRRTFYLQQLLQASDLLQTQRNVVRGMGALIANMFGHSTIAGTMPPNTLPTAGTNLRVVLPATSLMQLLAVDSLQWPDPSGPGTPVPILAADSTQTMIQGSVFGTSILALTGTPDSPLSIGAGNSIYYLIEAKIIYPVDQNNVVLPYQSLIQTITSAGSTTTVLNVGSTTGMANGDQIVVQGIATGNGLPTFISTFTPTTITLTNALASSPGASVVVRDVNPNSGAPLNGPGNTGTAQPIDRVATVSFAVVAGTPSATPTRPSAAVGFIPLWHIGPIANGATGVTGGQIAIASDNATPPVQTAPLFPSMVGAAHHKGVPGQSTKIALNSESDLAASAFKITPAGLNPGAIKGSAPGHAIQMVSNFDPFTNLMAAGAPSWLLDIGNSDSETSIWRARDIGGGAPTYQEIFAIVCSGLVNSAAAAANIDFTSIGGFKITRFASGSYTGTGSIHNEVSGISPAIVIILPLTVGQVGGIIWGSVGSPTCSQFSTTSGTLSIADSGNNGVLGIGNFQVGSGIFNASGIAYRWFAWG